jgi:hypothetical protein
MSEDIVERLRSWRHDSWPADPSLDAAAEIERLRARVAVLERVREAALPHLFTPSMDTGTTLLKALQDAKP